MVFEETRNRAFERCNQKTEILSEHGGARRPHRSDHRNSREKSDPLSLETEEKKRKIKKKEKARKIRRKRPYKACETVRFGELRIRASPRIRPEVCAPVPVTRSTPAPLITSLAIDHADLISAVRSDDL